MATQNGITYISKSTTDTMKIPIANLRFLTKELLITGIGYQMTVTAATTFSFKNRLDSWMDRYGH